MARPKRSADAHPDEAAARTPKRVGGRWKIPAVRRLLEREARGCSEPRRARPRVSAEVRAHQPRGLEAAGAVSREEAVATPPEMARHRPTGLGPGLRPAVGAVTAWGATARRRASAPGPAPAEAAPSAP